MNEANGMRKQWAINWGAVGVVISATLSAGATALAVNRSYFDLVSDVRSIKEENAVQNDRMTRIERSQADLKNDTAQQLRDIGGDVKEIRSILLNNAAGQRPDIARWSRR
ncbi:hypothetical protein [Pandoraea apista]|uniref:hypothetical protein n=1 Tax=Pandoraea apista TaxID=93218 RepID=UPI00065A02CF|nr:hypothetical protein [Pandoraea apista]ALS63632.1 hypothetical protein AT395_00230 [Pandoraea apista]CFB63161.1 hypothetical protein LMG16407_03236 [Pandoraea apista]